MTHNSKVKNDDPNMKGQRARNQDGTMRKVRSDKTVGHLEEQYGINVGRRSDMEIGNLMKELKVDSQNKLLKKLL